MEDTNITNAAEEEKQEPEQTEKAKEKQDEKDLILANTQAELERLRAIIKDTNEIIKTGKGRLKLETPIKSRDHEVNELVYDFTEMTGLEYAAAMDNDANAQQIYRITYRQGLALFATAAAKQTEGVDMRDIMEGIGLTDAVEGVQLATSFFAASTRAGRLRITKK